MVPINDLSRRIILNKNGLLQTTEKVLSSGSYILGREVKGFEESFANYVGVQYCVGVASGSDALKLALIGSGMGKESKVLTVANAGMYSSNAIHSVGATPVYIDIDPNNLLLDFDQLHLFSSTKIDALIVTHLFGLVHPNIAKIVEWCKNNSVILIEDCAQAHGAMIHGQKAGSFGDVSCFSFYPTKNLGALGDAGAVLTNSEHLHGIIVSLRQYGWKTKYQVVLRDGMNSRLDELQAGILNYFLPSLDELNARRRYVADYYACNISNSAVKVPTTIDSSYVSHLFVLRVNNRDALIKHLSDSGITTDIHYPIPDHKQEPYVEENLAVKLPQTESISAEILTIPCFPEITDDEIQQVVRAINEWK